MLNLATLVQRGVTIIELMITLAIIALALTLGAPAYWEWLQNTQIRSTAESMLVGIKLARAEALKRNTPVLFQLMTFGDPPDPAKCAPDPNGLNWVVSVEPASGKCDVTKSSVTPFIAQVKAKAAGMSSVFLSTSPATDTITFDALGRAFTFDALGRATPAALSIDVKSSAGACVVDSGKLRCLQIQVAAGGQTRMCDLAVPVPSDPSAPRDPRAC